MKKRYANLDGVSNGNSFLDFMRWRRQRKKKTISYALPQHPNKDIPFLKENRSRTTITWIGHSTFLIQMGKLNILTDPVYAKSMAFSKRLTEPGIPFKDLPLIDIVLISHGHYDHLDVPTIKKLGASINFLLPIGLKKMFLKGKYNHSSELSWWESQRAGDIEFTFVPAQHWTKRSLFDTNSSHWGGWIIKNIVTEETIYFAGDSGYFRGFKQIGEKFKIDHAILPIGAYDPIWFMHTDHMTPEEAIKAFLDVGAQTFIPMHFGAFMLADDTTEEALVRLKAEWMRLELDEEKLKVLNLGEVLSEY
jgi:L-ascorbate metabolism protein UlaG (beta-lactamase superfamily)